jgi:hypothetical protein
MVCYKKSFTFTFYSKLKRDAMYSSSCPLNIIQCTDRVSSSNQLGVIFSNLSYLCITFVDLGIVKPDNYHSSLIIDIYLPFATCIQSSYRKFTSGE